MEELYSSVIVAVAVFIFAVCVSAPAVEKRIGCVSRLEAVAGTVPLSRNSSKKTVGIFRIFRKKPARQPDRSGRDRAGQVSGGKKFSSVNSLSPRLYTFLRLASGAVSGIAVFYAARAFTDFPLSVSAGLTAFASGTFIPVIAAQREKSRRTLALLNSMAPAMDLLAICTSSGLGFDAAVLRIAERDTSPCIQELTAAVSDIQHGMSRRDAYEAMDRRCGLKEMTSFINALAQAEELGVSLDRVLEEQAALLRDMRRLRAEEAAAKAPVRMTIPLVLFIFPSIFIVLLGPAVIKLAEVFV